MAPTRKIALILTLIFLVPALFFSVYEISSLNKDEKIIEEIYQKQLEAILFSANQYSDDIINSWISKTEVSLVNSTTDSIPEAVSSLLTLNSSIPLSFVSKDTLINHSSLLVFSLYPDATATFKEAIAKSLDENRLLIQQLIRYKKSGFQKLVVLPTTDSTLSKFQTLVFIVGSSSRYFKIGGFVIDPEVFVENLVGPRLQAISKDQFILSVFNKSTQANVYSTMTLDTASLRSASSTKDLWIFPNYSLGIRTQGPSLQDVVRERTTTNLTLLLGLDIVLVIALVLVFQNVKKEVQLAQNKSDFVSNVSHEIRTPLALISMFAETLEMGRAPTDEKKKEYYRIISKETQRLTGIVNKILNFSQAEAGKKKLQISDVELNKEIVELLDTYEFHLTNKGFTYQFEKAESIRVKADRESLVEMVINLIDNAIKYSLEEKKIIISVGKDKRMGWIAVKDFGAGISIADQKHIFDKFYRVPSGDLARSRGTGLGLSYVKQLIEQQEGEITVTSELSRGSTFTLYFPLST